MVNYITDFINSYNLMNMLSNGSSWNDPTDVGPEADLAGEFDSLFSDQATGQINMNQAGNIFDNPFIKQELLRGLLQQQEQEPVMQFNTSNAFAPGIRLPVGNLNNIYRELQEKRGMLT